MSERRAHWTDDLIEAVRAPLLQIGPNGHVDHRCTAWRPRGVEVVNNLDGGAP